MTKAAITQSALAADAISAGYGEIQVLHDLSIRVDPGEVVVLLGRNGAGKSTTLLTLGGLLLPSAGRTLLNGELCVGPPHRRARNGLAYVLEDRGVFSSLTVEENLRLGPVPSPVRWNTSPNSNRTCAEPPDSCPEDSSRCSQWPARWPPNQGH